MKAFNSLGICQAVEVRLLAFYLTGEASRFFDQQTYPLSEATSDNQQYDSDEKFNCYFWPLVLLVHSKSGLAQRSCRCRTFLRFLISNGRRTVTFDRM